MNLEGEYNLIGVRETGCGIVLHANNLFDFYLAFGALDRHAYGSWKKISENEIELNTNYADTSPFSISKEERKQQEIVVIHFPNYNPLLMRETKVEIFSAGKQDESVPDSSGFCKFQADSVEKIIVTCMFYFDNPATLVPAKPESNNFQILPNQNLPLVHFQNARFRFEENTLTGFLHLLDPVKEYSFQKN